MRMIADGTVCSRVTAVDIIHKLLADMIFQFFALYDNCRSGRRCTDCTAVFTWLHVSSACVDAV